MAKMLLSFLLFGSLLNTFIAANARGSLPTNSPSSQSRPVSYQTISTSYLGNNTDIIRASFSHPPINLVDATLINDLHDFLTELNSSASRPKVVIFSSSVKGFFLSHLDFHLISSAEPGVGNSTAIANRFADALGLLSVLPIIFVGESNGVTIAAGNEVFVHLDMRFAGPDATFGAIEAGIGLFQLGGFRQLSQLIGAGRAAQYLLTAIKVDARTASRIGWINDMFEDVDEMQRNSDYLARRMALFPVGGLASTKKVIHDTAIGTFEQPFETQIFESLVNLPITQYALTRYLALSNNETDTIFETGQPDSLAKIWLK